MAAWRLRAYLAKEHPLLHNILHTIWHFASGLFKAFSCSAVPRLCRYSGDLKSDFSTLLHTHEYMQKILKNPIGSLGQRWINTIILVSVWHGCWLWCEAFRNRNSLHAWWVAWLTHKDCPPCSIIKHYTVTFCSLGNICTVQPTSAACLIVPESPTQTWSWNLPLLRVWGCMWDVSPPEQAWIDGENHSKVITLQIIISHVKRSS